VPRELASAEIETLLHRDLVARFATIDRHGYPHVTPIWFLWLNNVFYLTSFSTRPHVTRCLHNPHVGLVIDTEDELRADGERPNQQVRVIGQAQVKADNDRSWTARIRSRYIGTSGPPLDGHLELDRSVIEIRPSHTVAVASV